MHIPIPLWAILQHSGGVGAETNFWVAQSHPSHAVCEKRLPSARENREDALCGEDAKRW